MKTDVGQEIDNKERRHNGLRIYLLNGFSMWLSWYPNYKNKLNKTTIDQSPINPKTILEFRHISLKEKTLEFGLKGLERSFGLTQSQLLLSAINEQ